MAGKRAAKRYAKALFALTTEENKTGQIETDMRLIAQTVEDSRELQVLLKSPVIKDSLKLSSLMAIFKTVDPQTNQLFNVLINNKRIGLLAEVTQQFIALVDAQNKISNAEVTTAVPLTADMEAKVLAKVKVLTGNTARLTQKIDEKLIGGFLLRIGDLQYDASIAGKLNQLKQKFNQNA